MSYFRDLDRALWFEFSSFGDLRVLGRGRATCHHQRPTLVV